MKIKVDDIILKITKNKWKKKNFWKPFAMLINTAEVERDGKEYKCSISFLEKNGQSVIRISNLMLTDASSRIMHHEPGIYREAPVSRFKKSIIQYLLNNHPFNVASHRLRERIYKRRNTIFVFSGSIFLALIYYFGNEYYDGAWQEYIADNSILQALFILLNLFSVGSVFYPFTIQKQLNENDIRKLCQEEAKRYDEKKKITKRMEEESTF